MRQHIWIVILSLGLYTCGGQAQAPSGPGGSGESEALGSAGSLGVGTAGFRLIRFRDRETGTVWNVKGEGVDGPLAGKRLMQVPAYSAYWFAWASFWPNTAVIGEEGSNGALATHAFAVVEGRDIIADVPVDAIPPLDDPPQNLGKATFVTAEQANFVRDLDIVIGVAIEGDARAYPVKILNWHEIVNHTVGGQKIVLTYCPLTASGVNFDGAAFEFGNSGALFNNNMVMYDRETRSLWSQMRTGPISGSVRERVGRVDMLAVVQSTWQAWRTMYPNTRVLSTDTNYSRSYGSDIYIQDGYVSNRVIYFPQESQIDARYHPKEMVLGLLGKQTTRAYPFVRMGDEAVINDRFEGREIVVVFQRSAGMAIAYDRQVDGQMLTFEKVE